MVSTEDSDASWFILFFVCFIFLRRGELFLFSALSRLWWGLFFFFGFCLSADFWVTKRSPAGLSWRSRPSHRTRTGRSRTKRFPAASVQSGNTIDVHHWKQAGMLFADGASPKVLMDLIGFWNQLADWLTGLQSVCFTFSTEEQLLSVCTEKRARPALKPPPNSALIQIFCSHLHPKKCLC